MPINKTKALAGSQIRKAPADSELRFSFRLFDPSDQDLCPPTFPDGYTQALMQRMRDLSSWTLSRFTGAPDKSVRNHMHNWDETSRPNGFSNLNAHYRESPGWQFCISANAHGRVHGIIIDDTFYVVWLDRDHKLCP